MALRILFPILSIDFYMNQTPEKWLLIDNSNTRTKFMFAVDGILKGEVQIVPTVELSVDSITAIAEGHVISGVVVCSVVPNCADVLRDSFHCPVHFISSTSPSCLKYDYDGTMTLGADRIANAVAVAEMFDTTSVAIDAGTATTFDVVVNQCGRKVYVGGVIAPGYAAFRNYMHQCTAQLPPIQSNIEANPIGKNTVQAMQAGALYGFCGMVRGVISAIERELGYAPKIVLTGGDASLLKNIGNIPGEQVDNLTFVGLLHVAQHLS